jgi:hypothetical protein
MKYGVRINLVWRLPTTPYVYQLSRNLLTNSGAIQRLEGYRLLVVYM